MRLDHAIPQIAVIVHRIPILARLPTTQRVTILPEHIATCTRRVQCRSLPTQFDRAVVIVAELLKHTRLIERRADFSMILDPSIAPALRGRDGPGVRVEMVCAEVDGGDGAVSCEVRSLAKGVRIASVAREAEAFFASRDHVLWVEGLDVGRCGADPVCELRGGAAVATGLVGEFPCEDCRGVGVAGYDGSDVGAVLGLGFGAVVPLGVGGDAGVSEVGCHAAVVGPLIHKVLRKC